MELQSWTEWNSKSSPPTTLPSKSWMKPHHFPILVFRGGGINFPSISYNHRRQPGGILNINYSRLRDEIPAPGSSVLRTLVKAKLRWQTSEGRSARSLVDLDQYWPDFKIKTVNWSLRQEEWQKKKRKKTKIKRHLNPVVSINMMNSESGIYLFSSLSFSVYYVYSNLASVT